MSHTITATYEDGVFKPSRPLPIPPRSEVRLTFELVENDYSATQRQAALQALENLWRSHEIDSQGDRLTREQLHERR
jgi:predicted DNA-binding antitoxin AbrB/MazE fold protein